MSDHEVHVSSRRCAHHPLLRASGFLDAAPEVPWWGESASISISADDRRPTTDLGAITLGENPC